MASGSRSRKGKGTTTKNKHHPSTYSDPKILLRDPDVHISKLAFNREVKMIPSIYDYAYKSRMMP